MALNQNQFGMTGTVGTLIETTGPVVKGQFYSGTTGATVGAGEMLGITSTTVSNVTKFQKLTGTTGNAFGVVLTDPFREYFSVAEKISVAAMGTQVLMTASAAITAGANLQYQASTGKVATHTGANLIIGVAMTDAAGDDSLVRVFVWPKGTTGAIG